MKKFYHIKLNIDGDHSYNAVIKDFDLYNTKVRSGIIIEFDDYHDKKIPPKSENKINSKLSLPIK